MEQVNSEDPSKLTVTLNDLGFNRKQKRKLAKKLKRKQIRKEIALKSIEAKLNDEEEQLKLKEEAEMIEIQRNEFEERERIWIEKAAKKAQAQRKSLDEHDDDNQVEDDEDGEDGDWEYVEEGPAEIIWQGNEIIVKKKKVKVPKRSGDQQDANRPTTNPLPPQSEVYASYRNTSVSDHQVFESVSQQNPNFGTEQDKAHCPFHIKTGACRFGVRCSRAHFYPDKSCTLLIKNMYSGPGLTMEQDEGLEFTDEEIDRGYEEFYEDVHTEFLKFGEIQNFKVCRNGSVHLRGNVFVHYKSLDSAILAYQSINGCFFAGKQITCEYVGVTRWRIAICGEYMKSRLKSCSRGTACNFIHCFPNPGGDYEWADWDNPPPKFWVRKMAALFGPSVEAGYDKYPEDERSGYRSRRSRSREYASLSSSGDDRRDRNRKKHSSDSRKMKSIDESNLDDDHSHGEYSTDTDWYYRRSRRTHADRDSKGRDHTRREDERLQRHEKSRRWGHVSGRRETEWDEHYTKSEKYKLSDSSCDRRRKKSNDSGSGPSGSEAVNPSDRWETVSIRRSYSDRGKEEMDVSSDDYRKSKGRKENRKAKHKDDAREESDVEKRNGHDALKNKSGDQHSRKHRNCRYLEEDERKRSRKLSKRKDDKDVELERSSR
ncbi:[pyruvate dehydrogenase (acetyl-transferring)] kinase [Ranunculus cassubicifolius]